MRLFMLGYQIKREQVTSFAASDLVCSCSLTQQGKRTAYNNVQHHLQILIRTCTACHVSGKRHQASLLAPQYERSDQSLHKRSSVQMQLWLRDS